MSTDSPQIDITPYKVKRESVIVSQQQKTSDPNPNDDLASSILNKLTEIRGNLYPTHLNIPPHKSGAPQSVSPYGYSYLSASTMPQESGTLLSSGVDALLKKDTPDYSAGLLKSQDQSPSDLSRDSPIFETSYSPASQFYSNTFTNMEIPGKNTGNTTIPKIEMHFNSTHSHDLLNHMSNPSLNAPNTTKDYKTQFLTESSPQTSSPDYSPQHNDKNNLYHMSGAYEPHKNSLMPTNAHSQMNIAESIRTGSNPLNEKAISQNELYIPIARNGNLSPESNLNYPTSKSNPTSTRATQTKVHISGTARLPSAGKPGSRVQLINSLNEALKSGHDDTTADSKTLEGTHKRLEKSMEAPKKTGASKGEKTKPKNKSTVMLANIIAQNQDAESQRFSFGHVGSESSGSAQQTGRSNYSQKDREIQAFIDTVSKNQVIRAETLKKRSQNPASSTSFENYHIKSQNTNGRIKAQPDNSILIVEESRDREYRAQRQNNKQESEKQTQDVNHYNQSQKDSKKPQSRESLTKQQIPPSQRQPQKKNTLPLSQDAQSSNRSERDVSARDSSQEGHVLEDSQSVIHEDSTPQDSERYVDIEDNNPVKVKLSLAKGSYREKGIHQSTARTQPETIRNNDKTTHREAASSQVYSELVKSKPTTKNQLDDELSQVSYLKEPHASKTRSRLTTKSQFENLPHEDSIRSRPLTRSQLDDETRDSGQGAFQRFAGSGSGSSSPARSTPTDTIVAKKLDYTNVTQHNRGNESPIRLRDISAHSESESVVEKSYRSESRERSIEKNKAANVAESPKSSNKRVSEENMKPVNQNRGKRMESVDEREVIVSQTNIDAQDKESPTKQIFPVSQRSQIYNYSPERPNLGVIMSPPPQNFNAGNNTAQMQRGFNLQMSPNMNFQMQNLNLENDPNYAEYQQQMLMMTNYYQTQINNLKSLVAQQNETINQERYKSQMFERKNMELTRTIQGLEQTIKNQSLTLDSTQKELKARYEIVLDELASLKRTMLTYQVTAPQQESHAAPKTYPVEGKEYQTLLYHEILSLRKDLESQRSTMYDFRSSTRHLEDQMKDLEKMYIDELKSNGKINHKREHLQESLEAYKNNYLKMDTLNQILVDGYERTRKDLGTMGNGQNQEMAQELDIQTARQGRSRNVYIGSPSPTKYEVEATNQEMLRNKMKAEDSQMKNIMQWNSKNQGASIHYISNNFTTPRGKIPQGPSSDHNQQFLLQSNQSQNGYTVNRGYSPQPNQSSLNRVAITDRKANKSQVIFPTHQRMEDPRDQVRSIDQTLAELGQHKKYVENELFKMPSAPKTLDQKRKKAGLELELEGVENQIEECKNQLRKYT